MQQIELDNEIANVSRVLPDAVLNSSGLVYSALLEGGITRKQSKNGFLYIDANGNRVRDPAELARFASMAIPPAYTDVIFSAIHVDFIDFLGIFYPTP
jgi:DNA topoisomerase IB